MAGIVTVSGGKSLRGESDSEVKARAKAGARAKERAKARAKAIQQTWSALITPHIPRKSGAKYVGHLGGKEESMAG